VLKPNKLRKDGWTDPYVTRRLSAFSMTIRNDGHLDLTGIYFFQPRSVTNKLSNEQFQQFGRHLSTIFFTAMEFADASLFVVRTHELGFNMKAHICLTLVD
jgi:hypothetical protein